ncbi:helix-turn-helix transcriptional regulator [Shimia sp. W99]
MEGRPFGEISARIKWHREFVGMTQSQYAEAIGAKRAALNNWESGAFRLSLDGALSLNLVFGISLDFLYLGDAEVLPKTLRLAWLKSESEQKT